MAATPGGGWHFVLPVVEAANRLTRNWGGRSVKTQTGRDNARQAAVRFGRCRPIMGPTRTEILWVRQARQGDTDGRIKQTLDLLIGLAYPDDATVSAITILRVDDPTEPARVEIHVRPAVPPSMAEWYALTRRAA